MIDEEKAAAAPGTGNRPLTAAAGRLRGRLAPAAALFGMFGAAVDVSDIGAFDEASVHKDGRSRRRIFPWRYFLHTLCCFQYFPSIGALLPLDGAAAAQWGRNSAEEPNSGGFFFVYKLLCKWHLD